jgi:hypothetical protein
VRRDSSVQQVVGVYDSTGRHAGYIESMAGTSAVHLSGSPTVWVDGVQLTGGTAVTSGTLYAALTVGDWHIMEFRNLDLSGWVSIGYGNYPAPGYNFTGARGDILLYPSTDPTEDKDAARQWLADYYGVTLP